MNELMTEWYMVESEASSVYCAYSCKYVCMQSVTAL